MPEKYHIAVAPAPPRHRPIGKLGIVDWREDCMGCHNCVKRSCVYQLFRDEADTLRDQVGYLDYIYQCRGCLSCIQNCTKNILTRVVNPEYKRLGDDYYTGEIILSTWYQAETGGIPVSGAGYGGPFSGQGFDAMWTDMSEIVRPTRDGIHGREYINTSVDIGRKLPHLSFVDGALDVTPPPLTEVPLPIIFEIPPARYHRGAVLPAMRRAAEEIGTFFLSDAPEVHAGSPRVVPLLDDGASPEAHASAPMVMVRDTEAGLRLRSALKTANPRRIVAVRLNVGPGTRDRFVALAGEDVEVIHLVFDAHGRETDVAEPRHMRDVLREIHGALTKEGVRDLVTLVASGGIAQAEHVAKAIICGADLVAIDLPLMVALECRLCGECDGDRPCQIQLEAMDEDLGARRMVNLMGAWRNQLLELLGAMGIREARRLRGETGRAMFFEDLERDTFGRLFGGNAVRQ